MEFVHYGPAVVVTPIAGDANGTGASLTSGAETDIFVSKNPSFSEFAQLSVYIDQVLGAATKVAYGIYFSCDGGATWFKTSVEDLITNKGDLVDLPPYVDTNSPLQASTHLRTIFNCPVPGSNAFKITGLATGGNAGAFVIKAAVRDN